MGPSSAVVAASDITWVRNAATENMTSRMASAARSCARRTGTVAQSDISPRRWAVSQLCSARARRAPLAGRGAEFAGTPTDEGWGVTVRVKVPGAGEITLYEPKYPPPALL